MGDFVRAMYPFAPYGLVLSGLAGAYFKLPDIYVASIISASLALINPSKGPTDPTPKA
jgi:hypothetical protein